MCGKSKLCQSILRRRHPQKQGAFEQNDRSYLMINIIYAKSRDAIQTHLHESSYRALFG